VGVLDGGRLVRFARALREDRLLDADHTGDARADLGLGLPAVARCERLLEMAAYTLAVLANATRGRERFARTTEGCSGSERDDARGRAEVRVGGGEH